MVDIKKFDIATSVTDSLIDVFDMMLSMGLQLSDDQSQEINKKERVVGSVGLAGRVKGCINIEVSKEFSLKMAAAMLDMKIDEINTEDDVKDVIREMCNIVGGNLKSAFCDAGLVCDLSPPVFTTGDDFKIESLNTVRHERYVFSFEEYIVVVEVGIRVSEVEENADDATQSALELKPINRELIESLDIRTSVHDQMIEVFDMMLSMKLESSEESLNSSLDKDKLVGTVSFVGALMGHFNIHISEEFSRTMAAAMLGIEIDEVSGEEDVKDVISELCNIIGGNLKSKFCDAGMTCALSTPSLTTGSSFKIETKDMVRYDCFSFFHDDSPVVVDLVLNVKDQKEETVEEIATAETSQDDIEELLAHEKRVEPSAQEHGNVQEGAEDWGSNAPNATTSDDQEKIDFILDIPLDVVVELGRNKIKINELYNIGPGSVVEFMNLAGDPLDILVNGTLIAKGEVMVQGEKYGIRIVDVLSRMERIRTML